MTTSPNGAGPCAGGFVRMPRAWLSLPISPQAKTLLMAFCAYADAGGESWHSYAQLGEMLGRSKASVAAYVQELRGAGLVTCTRQTYGNGYNYRLRIGVVGWADWLSAWSRSGRHDGPATTTRRTAPPAGDVAARDTERRAQRAERLDPKGPINEIPPNHGEAGSDRGSWSDADEAAWRRFRPSDRDPPFAAADRPSVALLRRAVARRDRAVALDQPGCTGGAAPPARQMRVFATRRTLDGDDAAIGAAADALVRLAGDPAGLPAALAALDAAWPDHWRRVPSPEQLTRLLASSPLVAERRQERQALGIARQRAWIAEHWLRRLGADGGHGSGGTATERGPRVPPVAVPAEPRPRCTRGRAAAPAPQDAR